MHLWGARGEPLFPWSSVWPWHLPVFLFSLEDVMEERDMSCKSALWSSGHSCRWVQPWKREQEIATSSVPLRAVCIHGSARGMQTFPL